MQDRWALDSTAALLCASILAGELQYLADSGDKNVERIVLQMLLAASSYLVALLGGLMLSRFTESIKSWAWMPLAGALFFSLVIFARSAIGYHDHWEMAGKPMMYGEILHKFLPSFFLSWMVFAAAGAAAIVLARSVFYGASLLFPLKHKL